LHDHKPYRVEIEGVMVYARICSAHKKLAIYEDKLIEISEEEYKTAILLES
jgi:hypothetical protein